MCILVKSFSCHLMCLWPLNLFLECFKNWDYFSLNICKELNVCLDGQAKCASLNDCNFLKDGEGLDSIWVGRIIL